MEEEKGAKREKEGIEKRIKNLKKERRKQKSKDEQMCVEKIYIYSGIATASTEQQEKQLNISPQKIQKTHQEKRKTKVRNRKKEDNLK